MPPPVATGPDFASELRASLDEHEVSVRAFARLYAPENATEAQRENVRTMVSRWLKGKHAPSRRSRLRAAQVLGEPPERFLGPEQPLTMEVLAGRLEELAELVDEGIARLEAGIARVERRLGGGGGRARGSEK